MKGLFTGKRRSELHTDINALQGSIWQAKMEAEAAQVRLDAATRKLDEASGLLETMGREDSITLEEQETRYENGKAYYDCEMYKEALQEYMMIRGYKDVDALLSGNANLIAAAEARRRVFETVGSTITFGHYPQTGAGKESTPIEWIVLDTDGKKSLLLSRHGLDAKPYNEEWNIITWEECTLRTWLNGTFLNEAFTAQEQEGILMMNVDNSQTQGYCGWDTDGGDNTQDRVFLLSYAEANKYLGVNYDNNNDKDSRVVPTDYAMKQGAHTSSSNKTTDGSAAGWWWLRPPGSFQNYTAFVSNDGSLYSSDVFFVSGCVRPALWVNLESEIF